MLSGLYSSSTGLSVQGQRYDVIAHNLANASTTGFQRQLLTAVSFGEELATASAQPATAPAPVRPPLEPISVITALDSSPGPVHKTGQRCDFALNGAGYFSVRLPDGREAYTRNGAFTLDAAGHLALPQSAAAGGDAQVLGTQGPITITSANWEVTPQGEVLVDGKTVNQLQLVDLPNLTAATRLGETLLLAGDARPATGVTVMQGALEGANVDPVAEMVSLITVTRLFEYNQKCIQVQDATLDRAVNDVGRS